MNDTSNAEATGAAPPAITSRASYHAALRWGFAEAFRGRARRIVCCDGDLAGWPLDDAVLLQGLTAWLRLPQRRLVLLAAGYDDVPRRLPRFTDWRRHWAHAVECWQAAEDAAASLPTLLLDDRAVCVQLIDSHHWRGRAELDAGGARLWGDTVDALLQRSGAAFAANTLGL